MKKNTMSIDDLFDYLTKKENLFNSVTDVKVKGNEGPEKHLIVSFFNSTLHDLYFFCEHLIVNDFRTDQKIDITGPVINVTIFKNQ